MILRTQKGLPLTSGEIDGNFRELNEGKLDKTSIIQGAGMKAEITPTSVTLSLDMHIGVNPPVNNEYFWVIPEA
jgi:hypothetical protein